MDDRLLLKIPEVVRLTGWGRTFIYEQIGAGELAVVRVGRSVRVSMEALQAFIKRHVVTATPAGPGPAS